MELQPNVFLLLKTINNIDNKQENLTQPISDAGGKGANYTSSYKSLAN